MRAPLHGPHAWSLLRFSVAQDMKRREAALRMERAAEDKAAEELAKAEREASAKAMREEVMAQKAAKAAAEAARSKQIKKEMAQVGLAVPTAPPLACTAVRGMHCPYSHATPLSGLLCSLAAQETSKELREEASKAKARLEKSLAERAENVKHLLLDTKLRDEDEFANERREGSSMSKGGRDDFLKAAKEEGDMTGF